MVRLAAAGLSLDGHCMQYGSGPVDVSDPPLVSAAVGERECSVSCSTLHAACSAGSFSPSASISCDDALRWCCDRCAVSPPLPPPRVHRPLHPHVSLVASIEPGSRVGALRLMGVCVRQVWLWSYRGDEGATTSRGALRTLYGWRSWMHPAVTCSVSGLLCVVTLRSEVTARIETHDIARRCECARAR